MIKGQCCKAFAVEVFPDEFLSTKKRIFWLLSYVPVSCPASPSEKSKQTAAVTFHSFLLASSLIVTLHQIAFLEEVSMTAHLEGDPKARGNTVSLLKRA